VADLSLPQLVAQGLTDASDWAGLAALGTKNPVAGPGLQVDGYFADDDSTQNAEHGWNHDSQFVIRLPDHWNGKLVVTGAPGVRKQYADDQIFSDWFLARGYAYASIGKGNSGTSFYDNASRSGPGQPQQEWNYRVTELTKAVKQVVQQRYGHRPARTYMTGISNGGYLTRWQLENRPDLYDGGVDWEGTLFLAAGPNVLTYLPTAIKKTTRRTPRPAARRPTTRSSRPASRPGRSSCGATTRPSTGTSPSGPTGRPSTRRMTGR